MTLAILVLTNTTCPGVPQLNPMTPESNPRLVFERLFGGGTNAERPKGPRETPSRKTIYPRYCDGGRQIDEQRLGAETNRNKLDEYMAGVREIERRIEKSGELWSSAKAGSRCSLTKECQANIRNTFVYSSTC